jgi:hypothetical protein
LVLGALAALTVTVAPGGLAGVVQRAAGRLAPPPAPAPVPALAGARAAGFTGIRSDPYAAGDPFAGDPFPDDPFPGDPFAGDTFPGDPFDDGHGDGHGDGRNA